MTAGEAGTRPPPQEGDRLKSQDGDRPPPDAADPLVAVRLIGLPLPIHARAQEHGDALTREFRLIAGHLAEHPADGGPAVPRRLVELVTALSQRYSGFTVEQEDAIEAAIAAGTPSIDLTFLVPASAAGAATALGAMLDEADEYCREGKHLLTLATPPDLVAYRRWYLDEFVRQAAGQPPTPWPESAAAGPAAVGGPAPAPPS